MQILTHDELRKKAPSVFSLHSSENVSSKYTHISTIDVVNALEKEGYFPVKAMQSVARKEGNGDFNKHLIRFRHIDAPMVLNGLFPELVLTNSHNGLSSYKLVLGLYRLICTNGMVTGENYQSVNVRHQGNIIDNVVNGMYQIMGNAEKLVEGVASMGSLELNQDERQAFAEAVHDVYFDGEESNLSRTIKPEQFLQVRRSADREEDLFTVFNRAQENVIRGGLQGYYQDEHRRYRKISTRAVNAIDRSTSLNRALWTLAEKMAEIKRGESIDGKLIEGKSNVA
jgi:hypothetical protein